MTDTPNTASAPAFLVPGDRIALISPSYHVSPEEAEGAADVLRQWGFCPVTGPNVGKTFRGSYAGTPEERLEDLRWALEDPSIKAIICNRGGYGAIHFVETLPAETLMAHPKWLVGYSDITTLLWMEARAGVMGIHGTMGKFLAASGGKDFSSTLVRDILTGTVPEYSIPPHPLNIPGSCSGTLLGGNLSSFAPLCGTKADVTEGRDVILFIEDIGEDLSHIDRLFNTLILNGVLSRCRGIVLGEFTDCEANLEYASAEDMLASYIRGYGIPLCCGFPAGHGEVNLPFIMGAEATLEVSGSESVLKYKNFPAREFLNWRRGV